MKGHQAAIGKGDVHRGGAGDAMPRDLRIPPTSVPCPDCKAEIGEPCVSETGAAVYRHVSRRRMSVRAWRALTNDDSHSRLTLVRKMSSVERRAARLRLKMTVAQLSHQSDVPYNSIYRWEHGDAITDPARGLRYADALLGATS